MSQKITPATDSGTYCINEAILLPGNNDVDHTNEEVP
jgi:hypothetical protein